MESDPNENYVRVCIRVRPINDNELAKSSDVGIQVLPDNRTIRAVVTAEGRRKLETHHYKFDHCFDEDATQIDVFHQTGVESYCDFALEGYACTVFCFGQTGSGKTYTMSGPEAQQLSSDNPSAIVSLPTIGLQYRAAYYIWSAISNIVQKEGNTISLRASFVEIYNEQVNDLLNDTKNLKVRWAQSSQSFFIEKLMIVKCDSVGDILAVLEEGANNRKRASHLLNIDSSRSHVMFTLYLERRTVGDAKAPPRLGKINFVDLAGSEKLKESGSTGVNANETKSINKSLFALGNVICALSSRSQSAFVPYRDSNLTKLLMDSIGGGCRTLMIACVTPSAYYLEDTLNSLKYATRAANIVNSKPTVRMDPKQQQIYELKTELEMVKQENAALKQQLASLGQTPNSTKFPTPMAAGGRQSSTPTPMGGIPNLAPTPTSTQMSFGNPNFPSATGAAGGKMFSPQQATPTAMPMSLMPSNKPSEPPRSDFPPRVRPLAQLNPVSVQQGGATSSATAAASNPGSPNALTSQALQALQVAEKVKGDNERLREEVAQLRTMFLQSRQSSVLSTSSPTHNQRGGDNNSRGEFTPPSSSGAGMGGGPQPQVLYRQGSMNSNTSALQDYGFRPAPKRAQRLSLIPMTQAGDTAFTTASAPPMMNNANNNGNNNQVGVGGGPNPLFNQTSASASSPPKVKKLGGNGIVDPDVVAMRKQLEKAQRDMMLKRLQQGADFGHAYDDGSVEYYDSSVRDD